MVISMPIFSIVTKCASQLGFIRKTVLDEQLNLAKICSQLAQQERMRVAQLLASEQQERLRITEQHALEQQERIRIAQLLASEQQERLRITEQHALEQQERIRIAQLLASEQQERLRITEQHALEQQERVRIGQLLVSEERIHSDTSAHYKYEQINRLRVIKDYLDLVEDCITGSIYNDPPMKIWDSSEGFDPQTREYGWDWPSKAHTMIGRKRLHNLRILTEMVLMHGIHGDIVETGVWRGGACILARAVIRAYDDKSRSVWLADSFEGLPRPKAELYPADQADQFHEYKELAVSVNEVRANFKKYGLLDERVKFIIGWFDETLPSTKIEEIAILRLDGDMYESTIVALNNLYAKVTIGGYVIVDDYHVVKGCKQAIHDFLDREGLLPTLIEIDGVGIYWQKQ
jgi:O-methyltransferase